MKTYIGLFLLVFNFFTSYSQNSLVKFETTHVNFGVKNVGDTIVKNLKFKNVGTDTLVLLVYRENVDNLTININNYKLAPNECGTIEIIFTPKKQSSVFERFDFIFFNENDPLKHILFSGLVK